MKREFRNLVRPLEIPKDLKQGLKGRLIHHVDDEKSELEVSVNKEEDLVTVLVFGRVHEGPWREVDLSNEKYTAPLLRGGMKLPMVEVRVVYIGKTTTIDETIKLRTSNFLEEVKKITENDREWDRVI